MVAQRAEDFIQFAPWELDLGAADERELTIAFKSGHDDAYRAIYDRYVRRVESICRRMLSNPHDAQEATQEAFLRVYQGLPVFNGRYQLGAWVARITTNVCLDALRARSRRPSDPTPLEELDLDIPEHCVDSDPEIFVIRRAESRRVQKVLEGLPPMHRAAIVLRDFEGLSYDEVAQLLDISCVQTKALIHRARQNFKRSWTSSLASIFLPTTWASRIKHTDPAVKDPSPIVQNMSQALVTCNNTLQSCGQFVADRVGGVVAAAAVVGVVTTASVLPSAGSPAQVEVPSAATQSSPLGLSDADATRSASKSKHKKDGGESSSTDTSGTVPVVTPTTPPTTDNGDTDGNVTPDPEPTVTPTPDPTPTEPPAPPPEPQGFTGTAVYSGAAPEVVCSDCIKSDAILAESGRPNEDGSISYSQRIQGDIVAGGRSVYGFDLRHSSSDGPSQALSFTIWTVDGSFPYTAQGSMITKKQNQWGGWVYRFEGVYERHGGPGGPPPTANSGSYSIDMVFSTTQQRITSVVFSLN